MDEEKNAGNGEAKKVLKKSLFILRKPILILILVGIIALLIMAASAHELDIIDGTQDDSDPKNGPAAANRYINDVEITNDGDILLSKTPQELWDELKENGNRLTDYLSSPQELARLMNAQIATEYLDTNPDKEKDWDKINKDVKSDESRIVQGIVKLKRRTADVNGNETTNYLKYKSPEEFNKLVENGNNDALKYFTLDKRIASNTGSNSSLSSGSGSGQDIINEAEKYVGVLDYVWAGASLETGADCSGFVWAILNKLGLYNGERATTTKFEEEGVGTTIPSLDQAQAGDVICYEGHVAFYDGNGGIIHAPGRGKKVTHSENGATYKEIKTIKRFTSGSVTTSGSKGASDISSVTSTSFTREQFIEKVQSYSGALDPSKNTADFRNNAGELYDVCVANNINPILCAGQAWREGNWGSTRTRYNFWGIAAFNHTNTARGYSEFQAGVQDYCDEINSRINKQNGTVNERVRQFSMVNDKYNVDVVSIYDVLAAWCWSDNDASMSWEERANFDANYIEEVIQCANQIFGAGSLDAGASIGGRGSIKYKYVAKIAVRSSGGGLTTQTIEYKNYMNKYTLPFNYLFAMLIIGNDKNLVFDLADLVYNSKFEITIHDSVTRTTVEKHLETITQRTVEGGRTTTLSGSVAEPTEITDTYTTMVDLTLADSWIAKYEKEYDLEPSTIGPTQERETTVAGYPRTSSSLNNDKKRINEITTAVRVINTTIVSYTYTSSSSPKPEEKTDKNATEPNFVTVFLDNYDGRSNIFGAMDWLFEILEKNEDTKDMIDLTKYLFYKITGRDYGFTDFDEVWNAFRQESFNSVGGIYGGSIEEKVWFALLDMGCTKEAAAAALGNLNWESNGDGDGLRPNAVNPSSGAYGIAQWLGDRKDNLFALANDRGVSTDDENLQVEYLIAELTVGGKGIATYNWINNGWTLEQFKTDTSIEDAVNAWCWCFERCGTNEAMVSKRVQLANAYYARFKDRERGDGTLDTSNTQGGVRGHAVLPNGRTVTVFNQGDTAATNWGGRCNRAAAAIIASLYAPTENRAAVDRQIIQDMNNDYNTYGPSYYGAVPPEHFFNRYGLTIGNVESGSPISNYQTKLKQQLQSGGYAMIWLANPPGPGSSGGNHYYGKSGELWTTLYHWIPILAYDSSNNKIYIADYRGAAWYGLDEFETHGITYLVFINEKR